MKKKTLEEELRDLENLPQLPKEEQERIDIIGEIMADRAFEYLALGKHRRPVKRKK